MNLVGIIMRFTLERRAKGTSLDMLNSDLEASMQEVAERIEGAADTPENRRQARHVIGIERWSASRLASLLEGAGGQPSALDEYDAYQPPEHLSMGELAQAFRETRAQLLGMIEPLKEAPGRKARHNQVGPLDAKAWLVYVQSHTDMESRKFS